MRIWRLVAVLVVVTVLSGTEGRAESLVNPAPRIVEVEAPAPEGKAKKLWKISAALLGAVTIADMHSSMGRREMNPLLASHNGRFSARGISIKAAIAGSALGAQYLMLRKKPEAAGYAAGVNFGVTALTGAVAARNYALR
ncbi:MAG: hypothetical protein ACRD8O_22245 [Bryobacteraceae bacterium]